MTQPSAAELAERAALILEIRDQQDACAQFVPTPIQSTCQQSRARYRLLIGVNRGGKTSNNAYELAAAARRIHPTRTTSVNGLYLLFAPKRDQLNDPWAKKLLKDSELSNSSDPIPFIPDWEIEKISYTYGAGVPTIKEIELKNGNRIVCFPSDTPDVWKKIEGKGMVLGIVVDEAVGSSLFVAECATRLLDANSNPKVCAECGGGWMLWGATQNKDNPALDQLVDNITNYPEKYADFAVFRLTAGDNKAVSQVEREKLRLLMSEDDYKVRMEGTESVGGQMRVFPQWNDARHWITDPTRIHIPSDTATFWVGYDPGSNLTGMVLACFEQSAPRAMRVVRCWQLARSTIENDILELRKYLRGRFIEGFIYDQSSRKIEKTGDNVAHKLMRVLRTKAYAIKVCRGLTFGVSQYKASVPTLRQYLDPNPRDPLAVPFLTVNGDPDSQCSVLRSQILFQHFTSNAHELKESAISKGNDHEVDALRYLCSVKPGWTNRGRNPCLWEPGEDPEDGCRHENAALVLSEEGMRMELQMQAGARMATRRLTKWRNRSRH